MCIRRLSRRAEQLCMRLSIADLLYFVTVVETKILSNYFFKYLESAKNAQNTLVTKFELYIIIAFLLLTSRREVCLQLLVCDIQTDSKININHMNYFQRN